MREISLGTELKFCEACTLGKHHEFKNERSSEPVGKVTTTDLVDLNGILQPMAENITTDLVDLAGIVQPVREKHCICSI